MQAFLLLTLAAGAAAGAVDLNAGNFDDEVFASGKSAFIKFLAPWWGHCKRMKPDWDKLGDEYADSTSVLIGDVDCTVEADLCSRFGVSGYPTIKYYTAETGEEGKPYQSGRSYDDLKKFAEDELAAGCLVEDTSACSEKEIKYMDKMKAKGADAVAAQLERLEGMKGGSMKPELKKWLFQRLAILKQL